MSRRKPKLFTSVSATCQSSYVTSTYAESSSRTYTFLHYEQFFLVVPTIRWFSDNRITNKFGNCGLYPRKYYAPFWPQIRLAGLVARGLATATEYRKYDHLDIAKNGKSIMQVIQIWWQLVSGKPTTNPFDVVAAVVGKRIQIPRLLSFFDINNNQIVHLQANLVEHTRNNFIFHSRLLL